MHSRVELIALRFNALPYSYAVVTRFALTDFFAFLCCAHSKFMRIGGDGSDATGDLWVFCVCANSSECHMQMTTRERTAKQTEYKKGINNNRSSKRISHMQRFPDHFCLNREYVYVCLLFWLDDVLFPLFAIYNWISNEFIHQFLWRINCATASGLHMRRRSAIERSHTFVCSCR